MEDKIIAILKSGRAIHPSPESKERLRRALFANLPERREHAPAPTSPSLWESIRFTVGHNARLGLSLTLATILVFAAASGIARWGSAGNTTSQELLSEAKAIEFNIQLESANYFADTGDEIVAILGEIKNPPKEKSTDELLDKVLF